jgi:hypothetical protein
MVFNVTIDTALRRSTFSDWPINAPVSPNILCDNGFYYMGMHDKVQCAFCGGVLSGWAKDDDVQHEHARHFGRCELVVQHYVIKYVSDLRQVGNYLRALRFPPPIKLTATM